MNEREVVIGEAINHITVYHPITESAAEKNKLNKQTREKREQLHVTLLDIRDN